LKTVGKEMARFFICHFIEISKESNLMTKQLLIMAALVFALTLFWVSCSGSSISELKLNDIVSGTGGQAIKGTTITVHYTGWLYKNGHRGKKFDSSLDAGQPFTFKLGSGEVIEGWDRGIEGMRVGGKRELMIPAPMGYGEKGAPPDIPANSALDFEVQLLEVQH
jgi:FKBP-type peptidyl-prolyl cis-trans isomerase